MNATEFTFRIEFKTIAPDWECPSPTCAALRSCNHLQPGETRPIQFTDQGGRFLWNYTRPADSNDREIELSPRDEDVDPVSPSPLK